MKKDIAKSVKVKLQNIARRDNLIFQTVITRYLYERLLYRLSISDYREKFYLKGGALLYAIEKEHARPTLDIDFLGIKIKNDLAHIKNVFIEVCSIDCDSDGVVFDTATIDTEHIAEGNNYKGVKVAVTVHLDSIKQSMRMDIGFGDTVVPRAMELAYPCFMTDLPEVNILAYSLESVVAEKFNAMIELAESNSRYKDFYDIYRIISSGNIDKTILSEAIISTFNNRKTHFHKNHSLFTNDFAMDKARKLQWNRFLVKIKTKESIEFESVMSIIKDTLQPIYEKLNV